MTRRFIGFMSAAAVCAVMLAGCATAIEDSSQPVEFRIVGADSALCHLKNDDYYYKIYAPGTVRIQKTRKEMNLRCVAPGNRERVAVIDPQVDPMVAANVSNALIPGAAWDVVSGAAHEFPDVITVDFNGVPAQPMPLPEYQRVLNQNPGLIGLEEFRPGRSALISDYSNAMPTLQRRDDASEDLGSYAAPSENGGARSVEGMVVAPSDSIAAPVSQRSQVMTPSAAYGTPPAEFVGGTSSGANRTGGTYPAPASADSLTRQANPGAF